MANKSHNRFVSEGFEGVTVLAGERRGMPLLRGRSSRMATQSPSSSFDEAVTKRSLIESVALSTEISRSDAAKVVDSLIANITAALRDGHEVRLVGFGTFKPAAHAKKAAEVSSGLGKAKRTSQPTFKAGKALTNAVS